MYELGRLCVKIAGRDAGKKCVIVDILKENYVLIDGATRRKRCNTAHLEPLDKIIKIKKKATHADVAKEFKKLKIEILNTKPKKAVSKPKKEKKTIKVKEPSKKKINKSEKKTPSKKKLVKK